MKNRFIRHSLSRSLNCIGSNMYYVRISNIPCQKLGGKLIYFSIKGGYSTKRATSKDPYAFISTDLSNIIESKRLREKVAENLLTL
jgi:hypothetical protein